MFQPATLALFCTATLATGVMMAMLANTSSVCLQRTPLWRHSNGNRDPPTKYTHCSFCTYRTNLTCTYIRMFSCSLCADVFSNLFKKKSVKKPKYVCMYVCMYVCTYVYIVCVSCIVHVYIMYVHIFLRQGSRVCHVTELCILCVCFLQTSDHCC